MKNIYIDEQILEIYGLKIQTENLKKEELNHSLNKFELQLKQCLDENIKDIVLSDKMISILRNLNEDETIDSGCGIDYTLDLIYKKPLIKKQTHPLLFNLICLPKEKNEGIIKENHGMGYHIHYLVVRNKEECRTNIVFTFNPKFIGKHANRKLYWERHGQGIEKCPEKFKNRRKNALYDTSCSFLRKIPIEEFRAPKANSSILWPIM